MGGRGEKAKGNHGNHRPVKLTLALHCKNCGASPLASNIWACEEGIYENLQHGFTTGKSMPDLLDCFPQ